MLAPDTLGTDLVARGQEVIIHLACKDWNRNALESRGWQLGSAGFENVLALSGDYPVAGHRGLAAPVFDIDSVGLLSLFSEMNDGLRERAGPDETLDRTSFFLGCVVTNHKRHEREVMPQYFKLRKKVEAGARFVINQIGWDARKDDELLRWIRREALPLSVLANVYLLSPTAARAFHRGRIPGVVVTDELARARRAPAAEPRQGPRLLRRARRQARRRRPRARLRRRLPRRPHAGRRRSARSSIGPARSRATTGASSRGRSITRFADEFYFFEADPETGLSSDVVNAAYLDSKQASKDRPARAVQVPLQPACPRRRLRAGSAPLPGRARVLPRGRHGPHRSASSPTRPSRRSRCRSSAAATAATARFPRSRMSAPSRSARRTSATGRAAARATGSARSTTPSASGRRPTSGSRPTARRSRCSTGPVVVKDNALAGTSAWANAFLGRDHTGGAKQP